MNKNYGKIKYIGFMIITNNMAPHAVYIYGYLEKNVSAPLKPIGKSNFNVNVKPLYDLYYHDNNLNKYLII